METNAERERAQKTLHIHPKKKEPQTRFLVRQIMNVLFILMVVVLIALYFIMPVTVGETWYTVTGLIAILLKISEIIIRYLPQ